MCGMATTTTTIACMVWYKAVGSNLIVVRPKKGMHQSIRILPVWWRKQLASVQSTLSIHSMLLLGGLGHAPPGKF